jgi:hypothetical protein
MEYPLDFRVSSRPRDGFRSASAPYILKGLSKESISRLSIDDKHIESELNDADFIARRDELARRMKISPDMMKSELGDLFYELNELIHPGTLDLTELKKSKGKIDLQSIICAKLSHEQHDLSYHNILFDVYNSRDPTVKYTKPSLLHRDHNKRLQVIEGPRMLDYMYEPSDVSRITVPIKFRLHNEDDAIILISTATMKEEHMTVAINVDVEGDHISELMHGIKTTTHITYGANNVVAPFVIESMGLESGTIVMHVFHKMDGSAMASWMKWCSEMFERMLSSIVNTLRSSTQAYFAPGLGGQLPVDFFRALRGTIAAINDEKHMERVTDRVIIGELIMAYAKASGEKIHDKRMERVFVSSSHLKEFLKSFLIFVKSFDAFNKIAQYNKRDDRGAFKPTSERLEISNMVMRLNKDSVGMSSMLASNSAFADRALHTIRNNATYDNIKLLSELIDAQIADIKTYM